MAKRNSGEGVIYQEKSRGLWIYQVSYKDNAGMRKRKKFAAKTKQEAMEKGRKFLMGQGQLQDNSRINITVGEWVAEWLENYANPRIRPRTYEKYASSFKNYILPQFDKARLIDINPQILQKHFNALLNDGGKEKNGLSPSTVGAARRYFAECVDDAIKEGILLSNPVRFTKAPRQGKREIVVLTKDEVLKLTSVAKEINHPYMKIMMPELIWLAVNTGMRQGEIFALKWEDVDFDKPCIFVKRSLAHVVGKGAVFQDTKTKCSRRRILITSEDIIGLKEFKKQQEDYADFLGDKFKRHNLIFTSPFGYPISPTNFLRRYFKPLLKKCRISEDFTFHGLRHTHATFLLQKGVNPKIVQERLGHSSIKETMDTYSHVLPDMQIQAVTAIEDLFS